MTDDKVKIKADSFGNNKPSTVLLNEGLIRGGMEALIVKIKKETGQKR